MSAIPDRDELYARIAHGMGAWLVVWFLLTLWEPSSNTLVRLGLLVSSQKEHLFSLPLQETGVTVRTILAIIAVSVVAGFAYSYVRYITPSSPDEPPPPPASRHIPQDPPMSGGPMGGPMGGMPPYGGGYGAPYPGIGGTPPPPPPPGYGNPPPPGMFSG